MFASVGLMSSDPERAEAGLALKYDGYLIKYVGNEDLSHISVPEKSSEEFKAYCVEKIIEAYRTGEFEKIYDFFADDIQFHSQWVLNPLVGKDAVVDYFDRKGKTLKKSNTSTKGSVVVITNNYTKNGNVVLMAKEGNICALLSQRINGQTNWIFVSPKFNEMGQLIQIALNDSSLFTFEDYYAFE